MDTLINIVVVTGLQRGGINWRTNSSATKGAGMFLMVDVAVRLLVCSDERTIVLIVVVLFEGRFFFGKHRVGSGGLVECGMTDYIFR